VCERERASGRAGRMDCQPSRKWKSHRCCCYEKGKEIKLKRLPCVHVYCSRETKRHAGQQNLLLGGGPLVICPIFMDFRVCAAWICIAKRLRRQNVEFFFEKSVGGIRRTRRRNSSLSATDRTFDAFVLLSAHGSSYKGVVRVLAGYLGGMLGVHLLGVVSFRAVSAPSAERASFCVSKLCSLGSTEEALVGYNMHRKCFVVSATSQDTDGQIQ